MGLGMGVYSRACLTVVCGSGLLVVGIILPAGGHPGVTYAQTVGFACHAGDFTGRAVPLSAPLPSGAGEQCSVSDWLGGVLWRLGASGLSIWFFRASGPGARRDKVVLVVLQRTRGCVEVLLFGPTQRPGVAGFCAIYACVRACGRVGSFTIFFSWGLLARPRVVLVSFGVGVVDSFCGVTCVPGGCFPSYGYRSSAGL